MTVTLPTDGGRQSILDSFNVFRQELDAHIDGRDRVIKLNRDVTALSKKTVFLLHRVAMQDVQDEQSAITCAVRQGYDNFSEILALFEKMQVYLQGQNFWRLRKILSSGLQEYIEALSFAHYLEHRSLITFQQVQENLKSRDGTPIFPLGVPCPDYLLGVSDLMGELMRFAINSIGRHGLMSKTNFDKATEICSFVRSCKSDLEGMTAYVDELIPKQAITMNSLRKIEDAAYSVAIRGFERARLTGFAFEDLPHRRATEVASTKSEDD